MAETRARGTKLLSGIAMPHSQMDSGTAHLVENLRRPTAPKPMVEASEVRTSPARSVLCRLTGAVFTGHLQYTTLSALKGEDRVPASWNLGNPDCTSLIPAGDD